MRTQALVSKYDIANVKNVMNKIHGVFTPGLIGLMQPRIRVFPYERAADVANRLPKKKSTTGTYGGSKPQTPVRRCDSAGVAITDKRDGLLNTIGHNGSTSSMTLVKFRYDGVVDVVRRRILAAIEAIRYITTGEAGNSIQLRIKR